jgi:hypothetical protein
VTLLLGCFVASLLGDPAREQQWRNKGTLQAFFQAFPKIACFAPSFSKQSFGGFVEFQGITRLPNVI